MVCPFDIFSNARNSIISLVNNHASDSTSSSMATSPLLFIFCLSLLSAAFYTTSEATTAHDELVKYGFPVGLIPADIDSYTLNSTSGAFSLRLSGKCRVTLPPDNYLADYSKQITGKIVENRIAEVNGINVWAFFKWWGITGIRSSGQDLVFEVGMVTAKYPSKNFHVSPPCEGRHSSS